MDFEDRILRTLRQYDAGVYTLMELLPLLVSRTPEGSEHVLVALLPSEIRDPFREFVQEYPLVGGIQIRPSDYSLPISVIRKLKEILRTDHVV